jgi:hypothetical protein
LKPDHAGTLDNARELDRPSLVSVLLRLVHLAQDRGKPWIRVPRAVLRKVTRLEDEGRLALVPRTDARMSSLFMLSGRLSRESELRSRDMTSLGAVHQFAMYGARLPLPSRLAEDSRQGCEGERVAPRHPCTILEGANRFFESSS